MTATATAPDRSKAATETIRHLALECMDDPSILGILADKLEQLGFEHRAMMAKHQPGGCDRPIRALDFAVRDKVFRHIREIENRSAYFKSHRVLTGADVANIREAKLSCIRTARHLLQNQTGEEVLAILSAVDLTQIPVIDTKRWPDEDSARTKEVRELFKRIGLRDWSVTCDYRGISSFKVETKLSLGAVYQEVKTRIIDLLLTAYPNTQDQSDPQNDYYNFPWFIQTSPG